MSTKFYNQFQQTIKFFCISFIFLFMYLIDKPVEILKGFCKLYFNLLLNHLFMNFYYSFFFVKFHLIQLSILSDF